MKNNISKEGLKLVLITKKSLFQKIFTFYIGFLGIMGIIVCFFSVLQGQQPEFLNLETILLFIFLAVLFVFNLSRSPIIYFYNDGFIVG